MMLLMLSGSPGFTCWIDCAPVFSCYVMLSPNLCMMHGFVRGLFCKPAIYVS